MIPTKPAAIVSRAVLPLFAWLLLTLAASAAPLPNQTSWKLPSGVSGDWLSAAHWDPRLPTEDDAAVIDSGGTALVGPGAPHIEVESLLVGFAGEGHVIQSAGLLEATDSFGFVLGNDVGAVGSYQLEGGELRPRTAYVGWDGTGEFLQSGGTLRANRLQIAERPGSHGEYQLTGGEVLLSDDLVVGNFGTGTFSQQDSSVTVTGGLRVGNVAPGTGEYRLLSGTLTTGGSTIGSQGPGTFLQSGGLHTTGGMAIGASIAASSPTPFFASYTLTGEAPRSLPCGRSLRCIAAILWR